MAMDGRGGSFRPLSLGRLRRVLSSTAMMIFGGRIGVSSVAGGSRIITLGSMEVMSLVAVVAVGWGGVSLGAWTPAPLCR